MRISFKKISTLLLIIAPFLEIQAESEFSILSRIDGGIMDYNYEESKYNHSLSDKMPFLGIGTTLNYDKFFVDIYARKSDTGVDDLVTQPIVVRNFRRSDYSISFGGKVTEHLKIFAGYKDSETEFFLRNVDNYLNADFDANGSFIGINYDWQIGNGTFGINVAAAKLDGEQSYENNPTSTLSPMVGEVVSGNTIGFTFGLSWYEPINEKFMYIISLDRYEYSFDVDSVYKTENGKNIQVFDLKNYGLEENMLSISIKLIYKF